ncbi:hypothetical protein [Bauldia litoralis]|uniref:Uncharacterized protein n=1 Tax=Bauldia litoralis TaxID=665467 RepID=A0A1G6CEW3_9HYPH|nr:hypothetical protein [Bauldia litoralis]SDB31429.1 hypothetical protein SAMN02982931_02403 [Bauldia litoralis]
MARHLGKAASVAGGIALSAVTAAVAFANIPAESTFEDNLSQTAPVGHATTMAAPVGGAPLFVAAASGALPVCVTDDEVISRLEAERNELGGETVMLAGGLEQAFADEWRRQTESAPVEVSTVLAHVLPEGDVSFVDVIEIGIDGCALSRTIITEDDWRYLLVRAAGVGV